MGMKFGGLLGNRVHGSLILPGCMKKLGEIKRNVV